MTFGSLFSGIGGIDLGLERAGMVCKWQVEIDPYARRVLQKNWPHVPKWDDVRTFPPEGDWGVDLIAGGFPCQDVSDAGKREGIEGQRSGLWSEFARIIRVFRPKYIVVENVPGLFVRGLGRVLGDLASLGYDAEWSVLSACAMGAAHTRERVFILAYPNGSFMGITGEHEDFGQASEGRNDYQGRSPHSGRWQSKGESGMARILDGVPHRLDRRRATGNAVVPQVAEWIGSRIMEASRRT